MINFDDFSKVELKIGTILSVEVVEASEKLLKLQVDLGSPSSQSSSGQNLPHEIRQILAGIKQWYQPEDLVGKQVVVVANLEPRKLMGIESQGMILATDTRTPVLLKPSKKVSPGAKIR